MIVETIKVSLEDGVAAKTIKMEDNGALDEVVDTSFDEVEHNDLDSAEVELYGELLSMEDIVLDFDVISKNDSSDNVEENSPEDEELSDRIEEASVKVNQPVDNIGGIEEASVEVEQPVDNIVIEET